MSRAVRGRQRPGPDPDFPWLSPDDRLDFPDPRQGPPMAPLAQGGNLSPGMLLSAYSQGIFPWYSPGDPVLWWSPDPRFVLYPGEVAPSASMRKILRQGRFSFSFDRAFPAVIQACQAARRRGQAGTWVSDDMVAAYVGLHGLKRAHSVEAWVPGEQGPVLAGGLYGVSVGGLFCGESMFSQLPNASKACFHVMMGNFRKIGVALVDSQVANDHMRSLGGREISRDDYLEALRGLRVVNLLDRDWDGWLDPGLIP